MGTKTEIQQAPTVAAPSASQSAEDIFQARLKYDPLIAAQEFALQQQYMPQQAGLYSQLYGQYYPEYARSQQALQKELYPQQSQILEQGATQARRGLESAFGLAPEDPYQVSETERLRRQMRETRNIGGGLYSGRGYEAEDKGVEQLQQSFRQQALSNLIPYMQILYPQIGQQQPQISPYQFQSAVPGADQLYQAMYGASRPEYFASPGLGTQLIGLGGQLGSAYLMGRR